MKNDIPQKACISFIFKEHGIWQCRGFDMESKHFNRAFKRKADALQFMRRMAGGKCGQFEHY